MPSDPLQEKSRDIAQAVHQAGGRALLVGGYVRDELLGLHPKDADMEIYGLPAEDLSALLRRFGKVDCVGESFRVYKLAWWAKEADEKSQRHELDVSLPRHDKKVGAGHRGFEVEGDPNASVEDAARRRDFTVNAIMRDPLTGDLIDPFNGRADLEERVLRVVDAAHFGEDSLRVLRAMQFAGRFNMTVAPASAEICRSILLDDLPRERIWIEWEKLLLKSVRPSWGLRVARELDILSKLFPYLETAMARRGEALGHALDAAAVDKSELPVEKQVALMLAVIGSFLGWRGLKLFLDDLGVYTQNGYDVRANAIRVSGERNRVRSWYKRRETIADREFRFLSARCEPVLIYYLTRARGHSDAAEWFMERMRELGVDEGPPPPFLMGRHLIELGLQPGPLFGELTKAIYLRQLAGEITTFEEAIAAVGEILDA